MSGRHLPEVIQSRSEPGSHLIPNFSSLFLSLPLSLSPPFSPSLSLSLCLSVSGTVVCFCSVFLFLSIWISQSSSPILSYVSLFNFVILCVSLTLCPLHECSLGKQTFGAGCRNYLASALGPAAARSTSRPATPAPDLDFRRS